MPKKEKRETDSSKQLKPVSMAELQAMMQQLFGGTAPGRRSKRDRAQDLVYKAMETASVPRRLKLIEEALALDPDNVDALLLLMELARLTGDDRIEMLRDIVAAGARSLGRKAFKQLPPHFWGFHETRPYMRARAELVEELRIAGRLDEAVREYAEMLDLNENDNQGMRYYCLPTLLALGRTDLARALMARFEGECEFNVVFAWGLVLERWIERDEPGAADALAAARKQNPHMEAYLTGKKKPPKRRPPMYQPGTKDEADCYVDPLLMAWLKHPEAREWLAARPNGTAKPTRKRR